MPVQYMTKKKLTFLVAGRGNSPPIRDAFYYGLLAHGRQELQGKRAIKKFLIQSFSFENDVMTHDLLKVLQITD